METYRRFLDRIEAFEVSDGNFGAGAFSIDPALLNKVNGDNRFKPFFGDTVVFDLNANAKAAVNGYIDELYSAAGECFCERLLPHTLHMTLHDLSSTAASVGGEVFNKAAVEKKRDEVKALGGGKIAVRGKNIFNMVGTSIVLGLYPVSAADYRRLMRLYSVFDDVKPLGYPFTPHITLAYYNARGFDARASKKLRDVVIKLNAAPSLEFELDTADLVYQRFASMNDYTDIFRF